MFQCFQNVGTRWASASQVSLRVSFVRPQRQGTSFRRRIEHNDLDRQLATH